MDALEIIHSNFNEIPYAVVGGGAVQVYTASVAIKNACLKSVKDINGLSFILRRIGGIDLSFHYDLAELARKLNLIIERGAGIYTFHNFIKRFVVQDSMRRFNLNYQTEPEDLKGISSYYYDIINSSMRVELPYKNKKIYIRIARLEYLVISKLTRIRPKDQVDIVLLLKASEMDNYPFDTEEVRSVLKSVGQEDKYNILIELMDSV